MLLKTSRDSCGSPFAESCSIRSLVHRQRSPKRPCGRGCCRRCLSRRPAPAQSRALEDPSRAPCRRGASVLPAERYQALPEPIEPTGHVDVPARHGGTASPPRHSGPGPLCTLPPRMDVTGGSQRLRAASLVIEACRRSISPPAPADRSAWRRSGPAARRGHTGLRRRQGPEVGCRRRRPSGKSRTAEFPRPIDRIAVARTPGSRPSYITPLRERASRRFSNGRG